MSKLSDIVGNAVSNSNKSDMKTDIEPSLEQKMLVVDKSLGSDDEEEKYTVKKRTTLVLNRALSLDETVILNKLLTCVSYNPLYHSHRDPSTLLFEVLIIDMQNKQHRNYYMKYQKYFAKHTNIVCVCINNRPLTQDAITRLKKVYNFHSCIKRIPMEFITDGLQMTTQLLIDHMQTPQNDIVSKCYKSLCGKKKK